jgi:Icc-related predicted phosphoesterase
MKILATSDLHSRQDWFDWVLKQAPKFDAVVIAGDLLDKFADDLYAQVAFLGQWIVQMKATQTHLFLTDGNHDHNGQLASSGLLLKNGSQPNDFVREACLRERWMDELESRYGERCVVGGMVKKYPELDNLIVTSLPYEPQGEQDHEKLMQRGSILRRQMKPGACWIVLNHEPPPGKLGAEGNSSSVLKHLIEQYQPRMVFCGHDHEAPFGSATCCDQVGLTYVFNPGHNAKDKRPCHIVLETQTMKFTWQR